MSQENVEIMRRATEAINRRDREAWLALADPEAEFRADPNWPESETVRGREAVWDITVSIAETWEQDPPVEIAEVIDAGDDRVVARFKRPVRGKASGVETDFDYWWVGTFRSGRILRNWWFADRANALEAAGLNNAETLRRANEAFNRGDKTAWLSATDPDAVMVPAREWPEYAPIRGAEAIWDFYVEATSAWAEGNWELGETLEARNHTVVANARREARGRASGAGVPFSYWLVTTFRHGKTIRIEWFSDRRQAFEAAGLSE